MEINKTVTNVRVKISGCSDNRLSWYISHVGKVFSVSSLTMSDDCPVGMRRKELVRVHQPQNKYHYMLLLKKDLQEI